MNFLKEDKFRKIFSVMEKVFLCLFSFYVLLGSNNLTYGTKIISMVMWPTFLVGAVVVAYRVFTFKNYIKMPGIWVLIAMLGSIGLSSLVNYRYSFKDNVIICIYWLLYFAIFYLKDQRISAHKIQKYAEIIAGVFVVYTLITVLVSFYMMFSGISGKIIAPDTGYEYYKGFSIGRLWGVFINPNNGAISAAVASVILTYFAIVKKKWWFRILCVGAIFFELMFIALSDSRSGAVCVGAVFAVFLLVLAFYKTINKKILIKILSVVVAGVVACVGFFAPRQLKNLYNDISIVVQEKQQSDIDESTPETDEPNSDAEGDSAPPAEDKPINLVDRGYDLSDDISNRRFDVWKGALQLFAESPKSMAVGYSFKGFTQQAIELQPENYLVNNDFDDFTTLDNEIFNILVAQGLIGMVIFLAFVISIFIVIGKAMMKVGKEKHCFVALSLSILFGLSLSAMFCSVMFYHLSMNTILFWCVLGCFVHVMKKAIEEK